MRTEVPGFKLIMYYTSQGRHYTYTATFNTYENALNDIEKFKSNRLDANVYDWIIE